MIDSDAIEPHEIWASYELFFDEEENKTHATAVFHVQNEEGNFVLLTPPSTITFEGDTLIWKQEWATYHIEYPGMIKSGKFTFTDVKGHSQQYFVALEEIGFPSPFGPIQKHHSYELEWEGISVQELEEVNVFVYKTATNLWPDSQNSSVCPKGPVPITYVSLGRNFIANQPGSTSVLLSKNRLSQIPSGQVFMTIDRVHSEAFTGKSGLNGRITSRYRTFVKSFQLN